MKALLHTTLIVLAAGILAACGGNGGSNTRTVSAEALRAARAEQDPRVLHRSLTEPQYLDPGIVTESEGGTVTFDTFEGLYVYGPSHDEMRPGVATDMEVSEDGTVYTFTLRQNARWSDGAPVTAHDFEWSWKRVMNPATASQYAAVMNIIEGAEAYNACQDEAACAHLRAAVGVRALDDYTLEVRLVGPAPYFQELTGFYTYAPVPRHVVEEHGDRWARPEHMVSNGPWTVTEWSSLQRIVAVKNPHYWDAANMPFDRIVYHISEEMQPHWNMYQAGELDLLLKNRIPPSVVPRMMRERPDDFRLSPFLSTYFYLFNAEEELFDDLKVRKALSLAIDKSKIGDFVLKGGQLPAVGPVPPALQDLGYEPAEGEIYDPIRARELLAKAGYPNGEGFPRIKISYNTDEGHKLVAEYVQQEWKKNLGIESDLENMEWKVLLNTMTNRDYQIARYGWIGDFVDPMTFLDLFESTNPNNRAGWKNDAYDALIDAARNEADPERRYEILQEAEALFLEEMPAIPLYYYVVQDMVKPWVKGYEPHLRGHHLAKYLRIDFGDAGTPVAAEQPTTPAEEAGD